MNDVLSSDTTVDEDIPEVRIPVELIKSINPIEVVPIPAEDDANLFLMIFKS